MNKKILKTNSTKKELKPFLKGQDIIKFIAKTLPDQPGVYQMEDDEGKILYIGKAKNLAKRVINYTSINNCCHNNKYLKMNFKMYKFFISFIYLQVF